MVENAPSNIHGNEDIIILTETFLRTEASIQGYYSHHSLAKQGPAGRPSGGISCFFKPALTPARKTQETPNLLVSQLKGLTVISGYYQPECSAQHIISELDQALSCLEKNQLVIVAGDFNCRTDIDNQKAKHLTDYLTEEGFTLLNNRREPTYICHNGKSTIDLIFTNSKSELKPATAISNSGVALLRKHLPVVAPMMIQGHTRTNKDTPKARIQRSLRKDALEEASPQLTNIKDDIQEGLVEEAAQKIQHIINSAQHTKTTARKAKIWFDAECYQERRIVLDLLHQARRSGEPRELQRYQEARRTYKRLLKLKRTTHAEQEANRLIETAKENPFIALAPRKPRLETTIQMHSWESHFARILNQENKKKEESRQTQQALTNFPRITVAEVTAAINSLKRKKAAGPDTIFNEHLVESQHMLTGTWTDLFNKCIELGQIPEDWRCSTIKVLYKGKGDTSEQDSYRGIALENTIFKLFTKIITQRLTQETTDKIPEAQFGFMKGRATSHAIQNLLEDIRDALRLPKGKLHAVFIDYKKAFDLLDRNVLITKLEHMIGKEHYLTKIVTTILEYNQVRIQDNASLSIPLLQTNGVLQGDPLSPLLFNIATADVMQVINNECATKMYIYADDMVMLSENAQELQRSFNKLATWATKNGLEINEKKTAHMVFRNGGRIKTTDFITYGERTLTTVKSFKYLGLTLQTTGRTYTLHVKDRAIAASRAINDVKYPQAISLETAMRLFNAKVLPVITYGIEQIWEDLKKKELSTWENVKALYLKRILGVSKYTPSRLVYLLARETFLIQDIRTRMLLPNTAAYEDLLKDLQQKRAEVEEEFYASSAMIDRRWTGTNQQMRHVVNRLAVHGFHHKTCSISRFHQVSELCVCKYCGNSCGKYHVLWCKKQEKTVTELSAEA